MQGVVRQQRVRTTLIPSAEGSQERPPIHLNELSVAARRWQRPGGALTAAPDNLALNLRLRMRRASRRQDDGQRRGAVHGRNARAAPHPHNR